MEFHGGGGFRGDDYVYEYLGESTSFTISNTVSDELIASFNQSTQEKTQEKQHDETLNAINNQTQATQDLTNSINDGSITTDLDLPTSSAVDTTLNGLNSIFDTFYNVFTSDNAQDIVFPMPYTNKNITIPANFLENLLNENNCGWIVNYIKAFWLYLIYRFIILDVAKKFRQINSGNFEGIALENIKEGML